MAPQASLGRILVTGGCGFVGANLVRVLSERNLAREIVVVDNESLGRRAAIEPYDVDFVPGDIRDETLMRRCLRGIDSVVHLAADTRVIDSIRDPATNFDVNVIGTFRLLMLMREMGVGRLVNASTGGAIIGEADPPVHEDMPPRPTSPYGAAKASVEAYCSAFAASYGLHSVSLRFSNVYGPMSFHKGSVVAAFLRQVLRGETCVIYGDGSQTRDYVFVEDLCDGIVAGMRATVSGAYQLGSGTGTALNTLLDTMRPVVAPLPLTVRHEAFRDGEVRHTWADITRARRDLGFAPSTPLAEGLARTWAWFLTRGGAV